MSWKDEIGTALEGNHPGLGRRVELALLAVVAISGILLGIETLPGLPGWVRGAIVVANGAILVIFVVEYVLRLATARSKAGYVFSFYGIVDLLAIAPFLIGLLAPFIGLDLRVVRTLRLLRLFRLLKVVRYSRAVARLAEAWTVVKEEVAIFALAASVVLYTAALVVYEFEHEVQPEVFSSVLDAMWWAAITLTTVGYGDVYPVTFGGRLFTVLILLVALGVVAVPTGLIASALTAMRKAEDDGPMKDGD